jgi:hypothetical protein
MGLLRMSPEPSGFFEGDEYPRTVCNTPGEPVPEQEPSPLPAQDAGEFASTYADATAEPSPGKG